MPCLDCSRFPLCINYPDGTWRTVYDESQEEIARQFTSAKDIDSDAIIARANELVFAALAKKAAADQLKQEDEEVLKEIDKKPNSLRPSSPLVQEPEAVLKARAEQKKKSFRIGSKPVKKNCTNCG